MPRKTDESWRPFFLAMLIVEGTIAQAAREAGVNYRTVMRQRQNDPTFAEGMADALELHTQRLEKEAIRRATEGVERSVYFRGQVVGKEVHHSDTMLMFLLKSRRPEVYRESATQVSVSASATAGALASGETMTIIPDADRRAEVAKILADALGAERHNDVTLLPPPPME